MEHSVFLHICTMIQVESNELSWTRTISISSSSEEAEDPAKVKASSSTRLAISDASSFVRVRNVWRKWKGKSEPRWDAERRRHRCTVLGAKCWNILFSGYLIGYVEFLRFQPLMRKERFGDFRFCSVVLLVAAITNFDAQRNYIMGQFERGMIQKERLTGIING